MDKYKKIIICFAFLLVLLALLYVGLNTDKTEDHWIEKFIPGDTASLAYINIQLMAENGYSNLIMTSQDEIEKNNELIRITGIDFNKNIDMAWNINNIPQEKRVFLIQLRLHMVNLMIIQKN